MTTLLIHSPQEEINHTRKRRQPRQTGGVDVSIHDLDKSLGLHWKVTV